MNSLYKEMMGNQNAYQMNQVKQMMGALRSSKNPQQLLINMMGNNPQFQQLLQMIRQSGKSPRDLFYQMAQQKGVDPEQLINQLKQ